MKKRLTYRSATWADEPLIADFYRRGFSDLAAYKYPLRFNWMYRNNPFHPNSNWLPIWLAIDDGRIIGMSSLMSQQFSVNGATMPGGWCCDFRVLPQYRGMGVGTRLERMRQEASNLFSVSSSDVSVHIKEKLGYSSKFACTLFLHVRKFDPQSVYNDFMRYLNLNRSTRIHEFGTCIKLHIILAAILSTLFKVKQRSQPPLPQHRLNFSQIRAFPKEVDDLWNQIEPRYTLAVRRDSRYLNWKFFEQPHMKYQNYLVYRDGHLCGVLVFRTAKHLGIISELYTNQDSNVLCEILHFAITTLYGQGALMIKCCGSTDEFRHILKRFGFIPLQDFTGAFSFLASGARYKAMVKNQQWLITLGDHDIDEHQRTRHPSLLSLLKAILPLNRVID